MHSTNRLQEIRVRLMELQGKPCGPTKQWLIDSLEYVMGQLDTFLRAEFRKDCDEARRQQWVDQKMAEQVNEAIDWARVTGQHRNVEAEGGQDDRSGCY